MKTAGVVFDFYDDAAGSVLKSFFQTADDLPEVIKTAHILSGDEKATLRDDAFALVMHNNGQVLRKFACIDAGNTLLSALYFFKTAGILPDAAQQQAADAIVEACGRFGLNADHIMKVANSNMSRKRDPGHTPVVGDAADWYQRTNLLSVNGSGQSGRVMDSASSMKTAAKKHKKGEINLDSHHRLNPEAKPVEKTSTIDISGHTPVTRFEKKASSHLALDRYPLDSYGDVQKAVEYFAQNFAELTPHERHEFCVKTAARAEELGIEVSEDVARYGSTEYATDLDAHLANRKALASDFDWDKVASVQKVASPEDFAVLLEKADEEAGLNWWYGGQISDAYYATFGGNKVKQAQAEWNWSHPNGASVSYDQLSSLDSDSLKSHFDDSFVSTFSKNRVEIFESMPDAHKTIIANLAAGTESH
jgi:hypothetical protein